MSAMLPNMPFMKFGAWAAIGLAAVIVAADLNPENQPLQNLVVEYDKKEPAAEDGASTGASE